MFKLSAFWPGHTSLHIPEGGYVCDGHTYSRSIGRFSNKMCRYKGMLRLYAVSYVPRRKKVVMWWMSRGPNKNQAIILTRNVCFFLKIFSQTVHGNSFLVLTDSSISACTFRMCNRSDFLLLETRPQYLHVALAA